MADTKTAALDAIGNELKVGDKITVPGPKGKGVHFTITKLRWSKSRGLWRVYFSNGKHIGKGDSTLLSKLVPVKQKLGDWAELTKKTGWNPLASGNQ